MLATVAPGATPGRPQPVSAPAGIVRRVLPRRPPLAALLGELPEPERWRPWNLGQWLACWPAVAPSQRDPIAAHLLPRLAHLLELAAVTGPGGSSRLVTESRRLQRLLAAAPTGH